MWWMGRWRASRDALPLFGGFLDSILDRYSDLILFLGLLVYYAQVNRFLYAVLVGVAMAGGVMVSYSQARAESLIGRCEVGFWERPERIRADDHRRAFESHAAGAVAARHWTEHHRDSPDYLHLAAHQERARRGRSGTRAGQSAAGSSGASSRFARRSGTAQPHGASRRLAAWRVFLASSASSYFSPGSTCSGNRGAKSAFWFASYMKMFRSQIARARNAGAAFRAGKCADQASADAADGAGHGPRLVGPVLIAVSLTLLLVSGE